LHLVAIGIVSDWPSGTIALKKCDRGAGRLRVTASVANRKPPPAPSKRWIVAEAFASRASSERRMRSSESGALTRTRGAGWYASASGGMSAFAQVPKVCRPGGRG
jgi:hypothetical protein